MQAEYLPDATIAVSGTKRAERFKKIWAGIGWPDMEDGYLCVVGERIDDRYHCIWEHRGGLWELGNAAVNAKDRFLVDHIYVNTGDSIATSYFRTLDGLTYYDGEASSSHEDSDQTDPTGTWPYFRDRRTTALVVPVPDRIAVHYRSALELIRGIASADRLMIHEKNCPRLVYTLRQPLEDLLKSPVMKGLVWVVTALEESRGLACIGPESHDGWYGRFPREG